MNGKVLRVVPIVEGHGEVEAVPTLLGRIWRDLLVGDYVDVLRPIHIPRTKLLRPDAAGQSPRIEEKELERVVTLAARKVGLRPEPPMPALILILLDADEDCPKHLAPRIEEAARKFAQGLPVACVLPNPEYETWFVAAAQSLAQFLKPDASDIPADPENPRSGKGWVKKHFRGSYSETADQPELTKAMDLDACRRRAPSFDKLLRVLQQHMRGDGRPSFGAT